MTMEMEAGELLDLLLYEIYDQREVPRQGRSDEEIFALIVTLGTVARTALRFPPFVELLKGTTDIEQASQNETEGDK